MRAFLIQNWDVLSKISVLSAFQLKTWSLHVWVSLINRGHCEGGPTAHSKNFKRPFLRDIEISFQEVTLMDPEPHHFFSFSNISTNMVARGNMSPFVEHESVVATNFLSSGSKSNMNQDICLKFSASVHHILAQIWQKNFGHCSISLPATVNFGQNFGYL